MEKNYELTPERVAEIDLLNRENLVKTICERILHYPYNDCLTIGICGPWGSGKSSMIKFIKEELGKSKDSPIIVEFNPWNYCNNDQMIYMFFKELDNTIFGDIEENRREVKKLFDDLSKALIPLIPIAKKFSSGIVWAIVSIIEEILTYFGYKNIDRSPEEIKNEISIKIEELNKKIVVFIDDIDRMDSESIKLIFRLIRLNADFKKIIYVITIDREAVEKALQEEQKIDGRKYLEKIIQVTFDIPEPTREDLKVIFEDGLNNIIEKRNIIIEKDDILRHKEAIELIVKHFKNVREINRYLNGLKLTLPMIHAEINLEDFLVVELIRISYIDVYNNIQKESDLFLSRSDDLGDTLHNQLLGRNQDDLQKMFKEIRGSIEVFIKENELTKNLIIELLQFLYPKIDLAYSQKYQEWQKHIENEKKLRICSESKFYNYFLYRVLPTGVSNIELSELIEKIDDYDYLKIKFQELSERNILNNYIRTLSRSLEKIKDEKLDKGFINLINNSEIILKDRKKAVFDCEFYFYAVITDMYQKINVNIKSSFLTKLAKKTEGIYFLAKVIDYYSATDEVNDLFLHEKAIISNRIRIGFTNNTLNPVIYYRRLLPFWDAWCINDEAKNFIENMTKEDHGLCEFLNYMKYENPPYLKDSLPFELDKDVIRIFFPDSASLKARVKSIIEKNPSILTDEDEHTISLLLNSRYDWIKPNSN